MDAHERLMRKLYKAHNKVGLKPSMTNSVRLASREIERLRSLRVSWTWIAKRLVWIHRNGAGKPMPLAGEVEALTEADLPLSSIRSAFLRIKTEHRPEKQRPQKLKCPKVRDGPRTSARPKAINKLVQPDGENAEGGNIFFDRLHKLRTPPP